MPTPLVGQIDDQTGAQRDTCQRESIVQNGSLLIAIAWLTECVAERPVQVEHTRRFHRDGKLAYQRQRHRRHAVRLDFACQQSHGPRADRSGRNQ